MKRIARWLVGVGVIGTSFFVFANRQDPWLWGYFATFAIVAAYAMTQIDEDLARERSTPPSPGADRPSLRIVRLIALAHLVAGILDSRYGWSHVPGGLRAVGVAGFGLTFVGMIAAMRANRFFSAVVRIQAERGHRVVDAGPYRLIRHPGYAAMILMMPLSGLALGSWLAFAIAFAYSALIVRRVVFEDGFLHRNLDGYAAYAARVRYRLVPGLW